MDERLFHEILSNPESELLDFKKEQYRLSNDIVKSEFIKDVVSFANTKRAKTAYIVVGVSKPPKGGIDLVGVSGHHDDSTLQQIVKDKIDPVPQFLYQSFTYQNKSFGVIEIPVGNRCPYKITKDYGILKKNAVYIRRGSSTDEARPNEIEEMYREKYSKDTERNLIPCIKREIQTNLDNAKKFDNFVSGCCSMSDETLKKEVWGLWPGKKMKSEYKEKNWSKFMECAREESVVNKVGEIYEMFEDCNRFLAELFSYISNIQENGKSLIDYGYEPQMQRWYGPLRDLLGRVLKFAPEVIEMLDKKKGILNEG